MNISVISFTTRCYAFEPLHRVLDDLVASLPPKAFKSTLIVSGMIIYRSPSYECIDGTLLKLY